MSPTCGSTTTPATRSPSRDPPPIPEDGTLPASAFVWEVMFHHNTHTHLGPPIGPGPTGDNRSGSFVIPNTGETSTDVFYRIHLTVTDSSGRAPGIIRRCVASTPQRSRLPRHQQQRPADCRSLLDGQPHVTPYSEGSVVGMKRTLDVVSPQLIGAVTYSFSSWSDGGVPEPRHQHAGCADHVHRCVRSAVGEETPAKPVVSVTAPAAVPLCRATANLTASASDNVGVTSVKWYVDNVEVAYDGLGPAWSRHGRRPRWPTARTSSSPRPEMPPAIGARRAW